MPCSSGSATVTTAAKLINELGWRDFWQRMWLDLGDGIHDDQEAFKTGHDASSYARELPEDVRDGTHGTGLHGWLPQRTGDHRLAAQPRPDVDGRLAGALAPGALEGRCRLVPEHLLDGDPASNHLSWQWVASTFSHKPYFFNRGNLERYSDGRYCDGCPSANHCPFEGSYDQLENQLFAPMPAIRDGDGPQGRKNNRREQEPVPPWPAPSDEPTASQHDDPATTDSLDPRRSPGSRQSRPAGLAGRTGPVRLRQRLDREQQHQSQAAGFSL